MNRKPIIMSAIFFVFSLITFFYFQSPKQNKEFHKKNQSQNLNFDQTENKYQVASKKVNKMDPPITSKSLVSTMEPQEQNIEPNNGIPHYPPVPIILGEDLEPEEYYGYDPYEELELPLLSEEDQNHVDVYALNNEYTYEQKAQLHRFVANSARIDDEIEEDYEYEENRQSAEMQ